MTSGSPSDVLVVGGGVIGASIALELVRRGRDVLVLERDDRVGGGASSGNAGYLIPSHATPLASPAAVRDGLRWLFDSRSPLQIRPRPQVVPWLTRFLLASTPGRAARATAVLRRLAGESLELHAELERAGVPTSFERRGILKVYETEAGFAAGRAEAREHDAAGLAVEVLAGRAAVTAREPALRGSLAGAVFHPDEASCDPAAFTAAVAAAAVERGARIETGVEVLSLLRRGGRVSGVETTRGRLAAATIVLSAGVWSGRLARTAGVRLALEGGKGYHVDFATDDAQPALPVFLQEAHVTTTPLGGRFRLTGGLDLCGFDMSVDRRRVDAILSAARRTLAPEATASVREVWRGLRPCTPDGLPFVGRLRDVDGLVVCTGHAMLGLTLAPVSARIVADLVDGSSDADLALFAPERFAW